MLADHKQIDKRTTMRNQNKSAALGRPPMKLLGGGGGGGLELVFGRPSLALVSGFGSPKTTTNNRNKQEAVREAGLKDTWPQC